MMPILAYLADFFAGAFLCNALPHLLSGLQGVPFPSPFAKPPGKGDSSPVVNFLWGSFNLLVGSVLLHRNPVTMGLHLSFVIFAAGFLAIGLLCSVQFGKVQRARVGK